MRSSMDANSAAMRFGVTTCLRLATASNFDPSMATSSAPNSAWLRQNSVKARHTPTMAGGLSRRKLAMVLKSGHSRLSSHSSSMLRAASRSRRRLERT